VRIFVKTVVLHLLLVLTLTASSRAQEPRFFRIAGPVPATITALGADGYVTWTNVATSATFTVQTATSLLGESNWVDYVRVPATKAITTNRLYDLHPPSGMAFIPAGSFSMGDALDGESDALPLRTSYVSAFYMDVNLVSYALWTNVYQWATNSGYTFTNAGAGQAANHPVQRVDWHDCVKWCNARSQQEGKTPVYYTDAGLTQVYTNGEVTPYSDWSAQGYRLPTEAEWEKAARGGPSSQRFPWGNTISQTQANYYGDTGYYSYDLGPDGYNSVGQQGGIPYTSPVGTLAPNGYGLYDMAGNVFEWCWDWYRTSYAGGTDPHGPVSGSHRILRGGYWSSGANFCRAASRSSNDPTHSYDYIGFRCVLPSGQ
jgi:formylglycine-generating enzyme